VAIFYYIIEIIFYIILEIFQTNLLFKNDFHLYNMLRNILRERKFINDCIDMLSLQYNNNRKRLHKLLKTPYSMPEPMSSFINVRDYLYNPSDIQQVNQLVREQIKINKLILRGKDILICMHMDKCHP